MKVYLVVGDTVRDLVYAVMAHEEDAQHFANALEEGDEAHVETRELFYGQPPFRGFNP